MKTKHIWIMFVYRDHMIYSIHKTKKEATKALSAYRKMKGGRQFEYYNGKVGEVYKMIYNEQFGEYFREQI